MQFSDKTNWRKMLQNEFEPIDWNLSRNNAINCLSEDLKQYILNDYKITNLDFPIDIYPKKVNSLNLTKSISYEGVLNGVKGQYLIFNDDTVFNIRSNEGMEVLVNID